MSRSEEGTNDMEEKQEARKVRRKFTSEQKFEILKDIENAPSLSQRDLPKMLNSLPHLGQ